MTPSAVHLELSLYQVYVRAPTGVHDNYLFANIFKLIFTNTNADNGGNYQK